MQVDTQNQPGVKVRVKSGHRITIPKRFRRKHGIYEGDSVYVVPSANPDYEEVDEEKLEKLKERASELF